MWFVKNKHQKKFDTLLEKTESFIKAGMFQDYTFLLLEEEHLRNMYGLLSLKDSSAVKLNSTSEASSLEAHSVLDLSCIQISEIRAAIGIALPIRVALYNNFVKALREGELVNISPLTSEEIRSCFDPTQEENYDVILGSLYCYIGGQQREKSFRRVVDRLVSESCQALMEDNLVTCVGSRYMKVEPNPISFYGITTLLKERMLWRI